METVGQLIRKRRESLGWTMEELAQRVGITKGYISMIENHRTARPPMRKVINRLEDVLGYADRELHKSADWMVTPEALKSVVADAERIRGFARWLKGGGVVVEGEGEGVGRGMSLDEMYKSGELGRRLDVLLEEVGEGEVGGPASRYVRGDNITPVLMKSRRIPVINKVAAGYPTGFTDLDYPVNVADEYIECCDVEDDQSFAARVVGESMLPDFREGDVVVFSPNAVVREGDDCFVRLLPDYDTTFKRIYFESNGQVRLHPINPRFGTRMVDSDMVSGMYRAVLRYSKL